MAGRYGARLLVILAGAIAATVLSAQSSSVQSSATFRLFAFGREVGRETSTISNDAAGRKIESVVTFKDRGVDVRLTATVDADFDWEPRHLVLKGQPFAGATADLDVTLTDTRATIRDRGTERVLDIGNGLFFPIDGALPVALQESLAAYWLGHGRPASIPSAPGGYVRIQPRADEQIDIGGRAFRLQRMTIDGPVWGRQTAWVEPGGNIDALVTWVNGVPFQAVRDGFEGRLDRFVERAIRDRIDDLDKLVVSPEHVGGVVFTGATVIPSAGRPPIENAVLVVRGGKIAAVGAASKVKVPDDLPKVDATGMTIIPGLWDVDGRLGQIELGPLYLSYGITTVRNMGPDPALAAALREELAEHPLRFLAPRMLSTAFLDGPGGGLGPVSAATVDEARESVRRYRSDGYRRLDLSARLDAVIFKAAATDARRLGMEVSAGLPAGVAAADAISSGVDLLMGFLGSDGAAAAPLLAKAQTGFAPEIAAADVGATPAALRLPPSLARRMAVHDQGAGAQHAALLAQIKTARDLRVPVVGATGAGAPAAGLLREIEMFVEAGMSPADAIAAVTSVPARVLKTEDAGVIDVGKRADLVVLTGNPMIDIANIRTSKWVVIEGRMFDCEKLRLIVN